MSDPERTSTAIDSAAAETLAVGPSSLKVLLRSEQTGGTLSILEYLVAPRADGPPLHRHPAFDETFYVLEGTASLRMGDETREAGPGDGVYVTGDTPHTFANPGDEPLRLLILLTPGGFEPFFEEAAELMRDGPPDPVVFAALWERYGLVPA